MPRLLIVDDELANRELLRQHVEDYMHLQAEVASSGKETLDLLRKGEMFDLILLDVRMPQMSGVEVLEHLQKDSEWRKIPVVMVTADNVDSTIVECISRGAEDYLLKPVNFPILEARVRNSLNRRRMALQEQEFRDEIERSHQVADNLLNDLFPYAVVEQLKNNRKVLTQRYQNVAVLFCDVVGFTRFCDRHEADPELVVDQLQSLIGGIEDAASAHKIEKIKTIGDCFMGAANLHQFVKHPVLAAVEGAVQMMQVVAEHASGWQVRIGIHAGPVVAGILGKRVYCYDIWGDTVNTAARMQAEADPGGIFVSGDAWRHIERYCRAEPRMVHPKNLPEMEAFRFTEFKPGPRPTA